MNAVFFYFDSHGNIIRYLKILKDSHIDSFNDKLFCISSLAEKYNIELNLDNYSSQNKDLRSKIIRLHGCLKTVPPYLSRVVSISINSLITFYNFTVNFLKLIQS